MSHRRLLAAALAAALLAAGCGTTTTGSVTTDGRSRSQLLLVSSEAVQEKSLQYYNEQNAEARKDGTLITSGPEYNRVRGVMQRLVPQVGAFRPDAAQWPWQLVLINEDTVNAHVMAGGKITFYTGLIRKLKLTDDEIAAVMGHEMAHALREHARAQLAKTRATSIGLTLGAQLLGLGELGNTVADLGTKLLSLKFSRADESEADLVGLELGARAGYDPHAAVTLWQKMNQVSASAGGLEFLSTHPSGPERIQTLEQNVPRVEGLYLGARAGAAAPQR